MKYKCVIFLKLSIKKELKNFECYYTYECGPSLVFKQLVGSQ